MMLPNLSNPQAEMALLAASVRASLEQRVQMATTIREEWFSSAERAITWRIMSELIAKSLPIDVTLLSDSLRGHLEPQMVEKMTAEVSQLMPTAEFWKNLAERVRGYFMRRKAYAAAKDLMEQAQNLTNEPAEVIERAEADLFALHQDSASKGMRHISEALMDAMESIQESVSNRGYVTGGLPTGFTDLDRSYIKGMRPGHVIIFAAPPGGGKTVAMMKLAWNRATGSSDYVEGKRALEQGRENYRPHRVGIFSLEMDDAQLAERQIIAVGRVELAKTQQGFVSKAELDKLGQAAEKIKGSQMFIEHCPGISIQELRVKARFNVMRHKLDMICIDYAQLITSRSKAAAGNRTQEMMDVSKGIKLLAQECRVPVVCLAQPKQETWGSRCGLASLGETSQLAKDADLVVMMGSWDVIKKNMKLDDDDDDDEIVHSYMDIVKNRHGGNTVGKMPIKLRWDREFFDFISTNERLVDASGKSHQAKK